MAGFEDLIRNALRKQENLTPQKRAAIYQSSREALERMIVQNDTIDAAGAVSQRKRLENAINSIETDYRISENRPEVREPAPSPQKPDAAPAPESGTPQPPKPEPEPRAEVVRQPSAPAAPPKTSAAPPETRAAPPEIKVTDPVPAAPRPLSRATPQIQTPPAERKTVETVSKVPVDEKPARKPDAVETADRKPADTGFAARSNAAVKPAEDPPKVDSSLSSSSNHDVAPDMSMPPIDGFPTYEGSALRERKPYAKMLLWAIILAGIGVAGWWAVTFGPDLLKSRDDGSVPNPDPTIESGAFVPEGESSTGRWIVAFSPDDNADNIVTEDRGKAELVQDGDRSVARLSSNRGSASNTVRIKVPKGVIEPLRARAATFEVRLKTNNIAEQQFAIFCEFGAMGNCGRKRFSAGKDEKPFIFDVLINDAQLAAGADAFLAINTDLSGGGNPLDMISIRVRSGK